MVFSQDPKSNQDKLSDYFKGQWTEVLAYIVLIIGILMLFFDSTFGGLLVGIVGGIYFGNEVMSYIINWKNQLYTKSLGHQLISAGIVVAFFIEAPAIFVGMILAIAGKRLFSGQIRN